MRDLRAERIHRNKVRRARRWRYRRHYNRQGKEDTSRGHVTFWRGTANVERTSEYDRIQERKARRAKYHEANRIKTAARMLREAAE